MATTDFSLINAALTATGSEPITSFLDTSAGGKVAANNYDVLVEGELGGYPWKFASKFAQLARLDPDVVGDPLPPWTAAYAMPTDMLTGAVKSVRVGGQPIDHTIQGDVMLCDADVDDEVIVEYLWRVPEAKFPAWFRLYFSLRLEGLFLRGVGERYREAKSRDEDALEKLKGCKLMDSKWRTPMDPTLDRNAPRMPTTTLGARRA